MEAGEERRAGGRAEPAGAPATTARAVPAAEPTAPAAPAAPAASAGTQARGDVPAPAPASASRVHQSLTPVATPPTGEFRPDVSTSGGRRGSAATRTEATLISYCVVLATAGGVVAYLVSR